VSTVEFVSDQAWRRVRLDDEAAGSTIDLAVHFLSHGFNERVYEYSATGERGMGDSWGALQVRLRR
jgi:hypothetical protein